MDLVPGSSDVWWATVNAPDDVSTLYQFQSRLVPVPEGIDKPLHDPEVMSRYVAELTEVGFADPVNPTSFGVEQEVGVEGEEGSGAGEAADDPRAAGDLTEHGADREERASRKWESALTLPGAAAFPWHDPVAEPGRIDRRRITSDVLGNTRTVEVWTPAGVVDTTGLPAVVLLDGEGMRDERMRVELIFDNLVARAAIPPFVGVLVHNASPTSRMHEYPCNAKFATFVADELLPTLRIEYRFTADPSAIALGGYSYGGLASDWVGLTRPDAIGAVLSMSASLWWGKRPDNAGPGDDSLGRDDRTEWLTRTVGQAPDLAARFWIDVGQLEDAPLPFADGADQVSANRRFRDVLGANGYRVVGYREQPGGHDLLNWRRTLPDGLMALLA